MFSTGQMVFAVVFFIVFVACAVVMYGRDKGLHKTHYTGVYKVLIGFLLFIAFLFVIKGYLKH